VCLTFSALLQLCKKQEGRGALGLVQPFTQETHSPGVRLPIFPGLPRRIAVAPAEDGLGQLV
jgi:hypothetical protein